MNISVITALSQREQLLDPSVKEELDSIQQAVDRLDPQLEEGKVYFLFVKGLYRHSSRKMTTACLFINMLDEAICELHGVLRIRLENRSAVVAKTTIDFDKDFMGECRPREALLVHLNIPVKGLSSDETISAGQAQSSFDEVRVSFINQETEAEK